MEIEKPTRKKDWVLTASAFNRLLAQLDPDPERAGERYEMIRQKLTKFFQWHNCSPAEEYTDRTIDRVARRLEEGAEITTSEPYKFFHGIALNVSREHWKDVERHEVTALDELPPSYNPSVNPHEIREGEEERLEYENKLACLNECLGRLPPEQIAMITQYHQSEGGAKIAQRKELARQLGIPLNALRIRTYRLRTELEACVTGCLKKG
jgi:DNA-directed RNA polymerase specialized sigma24 family protein